MTKTGKVTFLLVLVAGLAVSAAPVAAVPAVMPAEALTGMPAEAQKQITDLASQQDQVPPGSLLTAYQSLLSVTKNEQDAIAVLTKLTAVAGNDPQRLTALVGKYRTAAATSGTLPATAIADIALNADAKAKNDADAAQASKKFLGTNWGLGVALTTGFGKGDRVASASVENGVVRVTQTTNQQPRIVLELHHFFCAGVDYCTSGKKGDATAGKSPRFGYGPWVGIQSSSDQVIDSFAFGFMVGLKATADGSGSFNIGIGAIVDAKSQVLADGVQAGQPLPGGGTTVPLKSESRSGAILAISFAF
jgi:hypothetical protein